MCSVLFLFLFLSNVNRTLANESTIDDYTVSDIVIIIIQLIATVLYIFCSFYCLCKKCIDYWRGVENLNDSPGLRDQNGIQSPGGPPTSRSEQTPNNQNDIESPGGLPTSRSEQIANNFHFQTILSNNGDRGQGEGSGDDDDDSIIHTDSISERQTYSNLSLQSLRILMLSSWRRPARKDECCICLAGYHIDDTICTSKKEGCKHVFHKECIVEWLEDHDHCPLCRIDLMN